MLFFVIFAESSFIMDYNSLNLHELTVFDLCDNETLRSLDIFTAFPFEEVKKRHLRSVKEAPDTRWSFMLDLAEHTGDKALEAAVEKQFADEIAAFFNE